MKSSAAHLGSGRVGWPVSDSLLTRASDPRIRPATPKLQKNHSCFLHKNLSRADSFGIVFSNMKTPPHLHPVDHTVVNTHYR